MIIKFPYNTEAWNVRPQEEVQAPALQIEVPADDPGGSYVLEGLDVPLVHYGAQDLWVLHPGGDIPAPKKVDWKWKTIKEER